MRATRRDLLRGLAGTAASALVGCGEPAQARERIGVVGGGMAGVATAWLLDGAHDVVLVEAGPALGGDVRSIEVDVRGAPVTIDTGAQYFGPGPYPTYTALIDLLGLRADAFESPSTITLARAGESTPRFVSPLSPDRDWALAEPWNEAGLVAFSTVTSAAYRLERTGGDYATTVAAWLGGLGDLDVEQRDRILLPWLAALYSGDLGEAAGYSARSALVYLARALVDGPLTEVRYETLATGLGEVLARMIAACTTVEVRTRAPALAIARAGGGYEVRLEGGGVIEVDDVVLATPPDVAHRLLAGTSGTEVLREALGGVQLHDARILLHRDPAYAHADPRNWSFLNVTADDRHAEASMWLAPVLRPLPDGARVDLWKSWARFRDRDPDDVVHEASFRHVLPTPATITAQRAALDASGGAAPWLAGSWTLPYQAQETALLSAVAVAEGLGAAGSDRARALVAATAAR